MSISSLRPLLRSEVARLAGHPRHNPRDPALDDGFAVAMLRSGHISAHEMMQALAAQAHAGQPRSPGAWIDHLLALGLDERMIYDQMAQHWALGLAELDRLPPDPTLIAQADAVDCLTHHWVPWRKMGGATVIACAHPDAFAALRPKVEALFGPIILTLAPRRQIEAALMARAGAALARRAETRVASDDSCRNYRAGPLIALVILLGIAMTAIARVSVDALILIGLGAALITSFSQNALKLMAVLARRSPAPQIPEPGLRLVPDPCPPISIIVALYKESRIVARLIRRLDLLDYPRDKLDVIFVIEDNDAATKSALASVQLPAWARVLAVPNGTIRTKPRALNYALDHCRGAIIGVYDAEDAPAPDQLRVVADAFAAGDDRLACLQGSLDYYNPNTNWLARCFTIEYAAWWRVLMPGIERMGLALPLGGTTLFFRKKALCDLGGWDAHNVTEDADLGLRLARRGYRTALIPSTTMEEANCRTLPWIKQRSRWIKGYMITWATHMRDPALLWREMGARRFIGFQVMFAGSVLHALLAPMMWALWLLPFGVFADKVADVPLPALIALTGTGLLSEAFVTACNYAGLRKTGHKINPLWLPSMILYNMLSTLAAYKALWEMLRKPFYWDKTSHGFFDV